MRVGEGGSSRVHAVGVLCALLVVPACGDDIKMAASTLPPGARCAGAPLSIGEPGDAAMCTMGTTGTSSYPQQPLGLGYANQMDRLPPKVAYLTFDDGPSDWTYQILDILKQKDVRATFFINARNLKGANGLKGTYVDETGKTVVYGDILRRAVDEGHALGNHTVNHVDLAVQSPEKVNQELEQNELLINQALVRAGGAPRPITLVRVPFGSPWHRRPQLPPDPAAAEAMVGRSVAARGINLMWTVDSRDSNDWVQGESFSRREVPIGVVATPSYSEKVARTRDTVLKDASIEAGEGAVILLHDTHDTSRDALAELIDGLRAKGYTFATLEEYVQWRWERPSLDLTPGPALALACVAERDRGCVSFDAGSTERDHQVCGRMWQGFQALGGMAVLGKPTAAPTATPQGVSQLFERGRIELHPDAEPPCNAIFVPAVP